MLAAIEQIEDGYIAQFQRPFKHSANHVWAALTENNQLAIWMSNLQVVDLRKNGNIKFNMNDGTGKSLNMKITDFEDNSIVEFEWGNGKVRFEVVATEEGCILLMHEFLPIINDHTPKDLAGWHVCLQILSELLDGKVIDFPKDEWEFWYEKYIELTKNMNE
ncbi:SRPBCC family protein [Bacillus massiliigorillae]|uniref:SRPBCC family protein n=1 Tax=Bacillus massiliigorillae TaxID=1243664 RepID=UPI0003A46E5D|nr:SRPBCC family protein [Bacillus massiliigorillae]